MERDENNTAQLRNALAAEGFDDKQVVNAMVSLTLFRTHMETTRGEASHEGHVSFHAKPIDLPVTAQLADEAGMSTALEKNGFTTQEVPAALKLVKRLKGGLIDLGTLAPR